jgi:hypothetical protein
VLEEVIGPGIEDPLDDLDPRFLGPHDYRHDRAERVRLETADQVADLCDISIAVHYHQSRMSAVDHGQHFGGGPGRYDLGLPCGHMVREGLWRRGLGGRIVYDYRW